MQPNSQQRRRARSPTTIDELQHPQTSLIDGTNKCRRVRSETPSRCSHSHTRTTPGGEHHEPAKMMQQSRGFEQPSARGKSQQLSLTSYPMVNRHAPGCRTPPPSVSNTQLTKTSRASASTSRVSVSRSGSVSFSSQPEVGSQGHNINYNHHLPQAKPKTHWRPLNSNARCIVCLHLVNLCTCRSEALHSRNLIDTKRALSQLNANTDYGRAKLGKAFSQVSEKEKIHRRELIDMGVHEKSAMYDLFCWGRWFIALGEREQEARESITCSYRRAVFHLQHSFELNTRVTSVRREEYRCRETVALHEVQHRQYLLAQLHDFQEICSAVRTEKTQRSALEAECAERYSELYTLMDLYMNISQEHNAERKQLRTACYDGRDVICREHDEGLERIASLRIGHAWMIKKHVQERTEFEFTVGRALSSLQTSEINERDELSRQFACAALSTMQLIETKRQQRLELEDAQKLARQLVCDEEQITWQELTTTSMRM